ncbi:MAG TPA: MFS transporter [Blastocatellia bacterium]|jgi:UMF1 family MFS transporter|nr:MFS transporter [Blastocatellia bacterium]
MNNRRELFGWYTYDWANSAFYTTVVTVFLGPYLTEVAKAAADADGYVHPLGIRVDQGSFFPYVVSLSVLCQMVFLPLLGAISDYSNMKKQLMGFFAYLGSFATMGLYFLEGERYLLGGALFLIANFSIGASIVFYNAFLPEVASPERRDAVSSVGFACGYLGGGLLLAANLFLFANASSYGLTTGHAVRISLLSSGVWWAAFTLIPMATLKQRRAVKSLPGGESYLTAGFTQLKHTLRGLPRYRQTMLFLVAYLLYNDGIQTVIALASQFGSQELGLEISTLTQVVLVVQFVAFFGATLFNFVAKSVGAKRAIIISLVIWTATVIYAYSALKTARDFFIMGAVIGIVLGGSQALSRSLYSLMIPEGKEAEYFSLYEVSDKGTSWLGPLLFGLALQWTRSYRIAILSLATFFIVGLGLLIFVNVQKAISEAGDQRQAQAGK